MPTCEACHAQHDIMDNCPTKGTIYLGQSDGAFCSCKPGQGGRVVREEPTMFRCLECGVQRSVPEPE